MALTFEFVLPERENLPRARFIHIALPGSAWTLCDRARAGAAVPGDSTDFAKKDLCPRCNTRKKFLERGEQIRRHKR